MHQASGFLVHPSERLTAQSCGHNTNTNSDERSHDTSQTTAQRPYDDYRLHPDNILGHVWAMKKA